MPTAYKTPGVYIVEKNAFPNSVVEVATAVPVFIGHTEKAVYKDTPLLGKPWRITSLTEFHNLFGHEPKDKFHLDAAGALKLATPELRMYQAMRFFYQNGGGPCYIVSVGSYTDAFDSKKFIAAFDELEKEQEPTLIVIPEAVSFEKAPDCADIQNAAIMHCAKMQNRFAILDVFEGWKEPVECIDKFRETVTNRLDLAAAYYPWLNTSLVSLNDVSFANIDDGDLANLKTLLLAEVPADADPAKPDQKLKDIRDAIGKLAPGLSETDATTLHKTLMVVSPKYKQILDRLREKLNLFPPSPAMAGLYTMVDNSRGVWKAPANIGVNGVVSPAVSITNEAQENLNVPTNGKAVNVIRSFVGEGTKVWGARTLDGNSLDWRYLNVRRTMIMIEESIRIAAKAYVFEPNVSGTWISIKGMIRNFLTNVWKRGGLAGAVPEDAFGVFVGLGETMTPEDILEGYLRVTVLVALSRPAEFIEVTFQQQMQKS